ncbi:sensor histidine kinase, partial [Streptomyces sampsonii]|uniref:sensor histidine kinase n=1 Tax=Streptomyces sampsonii TaxID=42239 RepID=UPI002109199A
TWRIAEILDNATRFSSPESPVGVTVWRLGEQAVVQIVDEGVGIPPDRRAVHNAALREPQAGVGDVRFMGLHVVARLAARHGIVVELRDSSGPGTIAEITLPPGVLVTMERNTAASPWETGTPPGAELAGGRPRPARRSAPRPSGSTAVAERERVPAPPPPPAGEPADRIAGVSASGLPVRKRNAPQQWPSANKRENTERRPGTAGPRKPPRRRDSRQVSDVLAAYAQGVNRSTTHRGRSTDDGNTERSK